MNQYDPHRSGPPNILGWLLTLVVLGLIFAVVLGYFV